MLGLTAQTPYHHKKDPEQFKVRASKALPVLGTELDVSAAEHQTKPQDQGKPANTATAKDYTEVEIGTSFYDTQTNGCIQKRLHRMGDEIHAAWTMAQAPDFGDRGTGYVGYAPTAWGDMPLERLEDVRVGWPSLLITGSGRKISITHSGDPYHLIMTYQDAGESTWSQVDIPHNLDAGLLWGHACVGGIDNNTIHVIGLSTPTAFGGVELDGQDGSIRYYRSTDEGETWDIQDMIIPGMGIDDFLSFGPDSYDIAARGDRVIVGSFNEWADSKVFISEDGGDNWNATVLFDFPVDLWETDVEILDLNEDLAADTVLSSDGSGQVYIDMAGQAHAVYGDMFYLDDVVGDDTWSYFPGVDGLNYWNETYGPDSAQYVGYLIDADESGEFDFAEDLAAYGTGSTAHPTIGEDAMGNIYVVYAGLVETHASGTQNYRHLHATKTEDGGETFSVPVDITPDIDFIYYEYAFPCLAPVIDDYLHIIAQRDQEPGTSLTDGDAVAENDIIYLGVTPDFDTGEFVSIEENQLANEVLVYPNPTSDEVFVVLDTDTPVNIDIYDIAGKLVLSQQEVVNVALFDVRAMASGLYTITITDGLNRVSQKLMVD